jgi:hypothetical protein
MRPIQQETDMTATDDRRNLVELFDLARNIAGLDERSIMAMDLHTLRATLREYRDLARVMLETVT